MNKSLKNIKKNKFLNISEVSRELGVKNHTLRYWENKFKQIKPTILSGRRYYSNKDIKTINLIKFLLKEQRVTIEGVRNILNKNINSLDEYKLSSITSHYFKAKIKIKSKVLLAKIKNLKK